VRETGKETETEEGGIEKIRANEEKGEEEPRGTATEILRVLL